MSPLFSLLLGIFLSTSSSYAEGKRWPKPILFPHFHIFTDCCEVRVVSDMGDLDDVYKLKVSINSDKFFFTQTLLKRKIWGLSKNPRTFALMVASIPGKVKTNHHHWKLSSQSQWVPCWRGILLQEWKHRWLPGMPSKKNILKRS